MFNSISLRFSLVVMLCLALNPTYAQTSKLREWGKFDPAELSLQQVEFDTSAAAVVLFDRATYYTNRYEGLKVVRHKRIKILKSAGINQYGNFNYRYFSRKGSYKISTLRAQTINRTEDGQIVATPVKNNEMYRQSVDIHRNVLSFAFPAVKVGSILEYEMSTESANLNFPDKWLFQDFIPTLYSEINLVQAPELRYAYAQYGDRLKSKYPRWVDNRWSLENLPALTLDKYVPNPFDYSERITFQLSKSTYPGIELTDWRMLTDRLLLSYRDYIKNNRDYSKVSADVVGDVADTLEVIQRLYNFVASKYKWDKRYSCFPEKSRKEFMNSMSGNSSEKNLYLVGLLRNVGLEADPAILSTRFHGVVYKKVPILDEYNHLVVAVSYRGNPMILDAASPGRPYSIADEETIGCEGYRLSSSNPGWIRILSSLNTTVKANCSMDFTDGMMRGVLHISFSGHKAIEERAKLKRTTAEEYGAALSNITNITVDSVKVENGDDFTKELKVHVFYSSDVGKMKSEQIHLASMAFVPLMKNPFSVDDRKMPVSLRYPYEFSYEGEIKIPEGYTLDGGLISSNNGISANDTYTISSSYNPENRTIRVSGVLKVGTIFYSSDRYPILRSFFETAVSKSFTSITLKKS